MGFLNKYTLTAAAAALAFSTAPASAADFGGDCCADLEERVAVLEATTARKGNRKVSLVISGQVNNAIMFWDDGVDDDVYIVNNSNSTTRFRFKGNAEINYDLSAGYYIEFELRGANSSRVNATSDDGSDPDLLNIRHSNFYLKSKSLGTLTIGQQSPATDDLAFYASVAGVAGHFQPDWHYSFGFELNNAAGMGSGITISELAGSINGTIYFDGSTRQNLIRYDTPTIAGFTITASWGEDDFYDIAIKTTQKFGDFTFKGGIGYSVFDESTETDLVGEERAITASIGLIHNPTGLFAHGAWRSYEYDMVQPDAEGYQVQLGIKNKWNSLGATAIYGAYTNVEDGFVRSTVFSMAPDGIVTSEIDRWSVGVTQWIDAAAMELFGLYNHTEAEVNGVDLEDFDSVIVGGRIRF